MLAGFGKNVSHQEIERVLSESEEWWRAANEQTGIEWVPLDGIKNFLCQDLGYEDIDEFEDALQGTFEEFMRCFPHIELRTSIAVADENDEPSWEFRVRPLRPGPPRKMCLRVEDSRQLLDTCFMKAPDAEIELPAIGMTIGADQKRIIDSLWNHVERAKQNLETHATSLGGGSEEAAKLLEVVQQLASMLDVEEPFVLLIHDPTSQSELNPVDGVEIEELEAGVGSALCAVNEEDANKVGPDEEGADEEGGARQCVEEGGRTKEDEVVAERKAENEDNRAGEIADVAEER